MVHYRTHKRPPHVPVLGQPNPVHIPTSHLLEIHPNIIHPSTPSSPQWSLSLRFPHQDPIHPPSPHPYAPHAQPISFFLILSPARYWVSSTKHLSLRYAISSSPPLPRPSSVQIFSSTPCSQTPSAPNTELICIKLGIANTKQTKSIRSRSASGGGRPLRLTALSPQTTVQASISLSYARIQCSHCATQLTHLTT